MTAIEAVITMCIPVAKKIPMRGEFQSLVGIGSKWGPLDETSNPLFPQHIDFLVLTHNNILLYC